MSQAAVVSPPHQIARVARLGGPDAARADDVRGHCADAPQRRRRRAGARRQRVVIHAVGNVAAQRAGLAVDLREKSGARGSARRRLAGAERRAARGLTPRPRRRAQRGDATHGSQRRQRVAHARKGAAGAAERGAAVRAAAAQQHAGRRAARLAIRRANGVGLRGEGGGGGARAPLMMPTRAAAWPFRRKEERLVGNIDDDDDAPIYGPEKRMCRGTGTTARWSTGRLSMPATTHASSRTLAARAVAAGRTCDAHGVQAASDATF